MESLERPPVPEIDCRVYAPHYGNCHARIKCDWEREYCFLKNEGEDYFHLLQCGEIYIEQDDEKYCLTCAMKLGLITRNRLYWQLAPRPQKEMPF